MEKTGKSFSEILKECETQHSKIFNDGKIVDASKWKIVGKEVHVDDFESPRLIQSNKDYI